MLSDKQYTIITDNCITITKESNMLFEVLDKNPKVEELVDYINDKLEAVLSACSEINEVKLELKK